MRPSSPRTTKFVLGLSLLGIAACSNEIAAPIALAPSSAAFAKQGRIKAKNSVRYSAKGAKPAKGTAGATSIEFRALLTRDGQTLLEATTGTFDGTAARGNIDKVQLKISGRKGKPGTVNFNGLKAGGFWTQSIAGRAPGDTITIQVSVSGINGKKTDVVSATTTVIPLPDIAVLAAHAPAAVSPHMSGDITADVAELNGAVGGTANCVLWVNGTAVDHANGIWVDAGGVVNCAFHYTFGDPGAYTVAVTASDVSPVDWNPDNNSATTTVIVPGPGLEFNTGYLEAYQFDISGLSSTDRSDPVPAHTLNNQTAHYSAVYMSAMASGSNAQDAVGVLMASIKADGNEVAAFTLPLQDHTLSLVDGWLEDCAKYSDMGRWASICTRTNTSNPAEKNTRADFQNLAGTITYLGYEYYCANRGDCDVYEWNRSSVYSGGDWYNFAAGQTVNVSLSYIGSTGSSQSLNRDVLLTDRSPEMTVSSILCGVDQTQGFDYCYKELRSGSWYFGKAIW